MVLPYPLDAPTGPASMTPAIGHAPDTGDKPLIVRFRQGTESRRPAPANKWIWTHRNMPFDIVGWRINEEK